MVSLTYYHNGLQPPLRGNIIDIMEFIFLLVKRHRGDEFSFHIKIEE